MTPSKERTLKIQSIKYFIIEGKLYWKDPLVFLLRCLIEFETEGIIEEFHREYVGGVMLGEKQHTKF
jgi:hypothetical protein